MHLERLHDCVSQKLDLEHDRQCMYDVTVRRVRATTFAVEKQYVLHYVSVCL